MGMALLTACTMLVSCDENTGMIGSTLTDYRDTLSVTADTFHVTSHTLTVDSVLARNITGYLGVVKDPETQNIITGNFMSQFNLLDNFNLKIDSAQMFKDNKGQIIADSADVRLYYQSLYGDSLAQMKVTAMELQKPLEEGVPIYSNFDPEKGYVREGGLTASRTYTLVDYTQKDSLRTTSGFVPNFRIKLDGAYTDKAGNTYTNYGSYILDNYYKHPEYFGSRYAFLHNLVPGFYFKMTDGIGSMAYITAAQLNIFFHYTNDSAKVVTASTSFSGTEEVLQTTTINNDNEMLEQMAANTSCTYLKSPAGLFTEITLPVEKIMKGHETDTLNEVKISIPCYNSTTATGYELQPSEYVLMLPSDSLNTFFANNSLPNSKTSFLCAYGSSTNSYVFNNISGIVSSMYNGPRTSANWNKVVIVPVSVTKLTSGSSSSSTTTISKVAHNMGMSSVRLLGGESNPEALSVSVVYSKFGK